MPCTILPFAQLDEPARPRRDAPSTRLRAILVVDPTAMTHAAPRHSYALRDYLDVEEVSVVRHELVDAEIVALASGTPEHTALASGIPA
jgi:hypothetical protein